MPDLLTPQVLATAGPLVLETFIKHYLGPKRPKDEKAREDLMYDEAFVLMKTFLEIATKHPCAALQRFSLVRTPAPPWVALHRVLIPQSSSNQAAEFLITALGGEEMAYKIAGGSKWWQVRAGPGVEGEWIAMKKDWKEAVAAKSAATKKEKERAKSTHQAPQSKTEKMSGEDAMEEGMVGEDGGVNQDGGFRKEMDELRCMLYIHGGAYYWGSINTHRYTIWRYARKMHGRCFAVNYRKAPQYPFPCAIQDCLAAWLYLVNPPAEAKHKPVHPKNIILAGDSAGGGLVWALLQILRDTPGLDLPAGAVLISPWSDLTHSFPSILSNTATDIVPPYSFIHKPSSLWPPPPPALTDEIQGTMRSRVKDAVSRLKGDHHSPLHLHHQNHEHAEIKSSLVHEPTPNPTLHSSSPHGKLPGKEKHHEDELHPISKQADVSHQPSSSGEPGPSPHRANPALAFSNLQDRADGMQEAAVRQTTLTQCEAPLRLEVKDTNVVIDTQIQLYATNAQLCHPWVSPALGYLGGLPPLLIIAGDKEVLRDEIIYAAHKAANPKDHPIRDDVKAMLPSLQGIEERYKPTNVHLQVYDGACHDLPLFSMTKMSVGLFRAIASFARYVTPTAPGSLSISKSQVNTPSGSGSRTPTTPPTETSLLDIEQPTLGTQIAATPVHLTPRSSQTDISNDEMRKSLAKLTFTSTDDDGRDVVSSPATVSSKSSGKPMKVARFTHTDDMPNQGRERPASEDETSARPTRPPKPELSGDDAGPRFGDDPANKDSRALPGQAGHSGIYRGLNPFKDHMIRERVGTDGTCRALEPMDELEALQMPRDEIGMIKEGPAMRYLTGQALWDKKYKRAIKTVKRHREKNLRNAHERDSGKIAKMWEQRIKERREEKDRKVEVTNSVTTGSSEQEDQDEGWETEGPENEEEGEDHISRDLTRTAELDILDQSWSWSWALGGEAPPPSAIVSRRDFSEARQLAMMADRMDTPDSALNGLSLWVGLASFFSNSSERSKAEAALKRAHEEKEAEKAGRGTFPGQSALGHGTMEGIEKKARGFGRIFGKGRT